MMRNKTAGKTYRPVFSAAKTDIHSVISGLSMETA